MPVEREEIRLAVPSTTERSSRSGCVRRTGGATPLRRSAPRKLLALALLIEQLTGVGCHSRVVDGTRTRSPAVVSDLALGASAAHDCALMSDSTVRCRGSNWAGQLGIGSAADEPTVSTSVDGLHDIVQVVVDSVLGASCALSSRGQVYCWGSNDDGLVGVGHHRDEVCRGTQQHRCRTRPVAVPGLPPIRRLIASGVSFCALSLDGETFCWGELGASVFGTAPSPVPVIARAWTGAVDLWGGRSFSYLRMRDGRFIEFPGGRVLPVPASALVPRETAGIVCYTQSDRVHCIESSRLPQERSDGSAQTGSAIALELAPVTSLSVGAFHGCASVVGGDLWCWGRSYLGALGRTETVLSSCDDDPSERCTSRPTRVSGVGAVRRVVVGLGRTCVIQTSGVVLCWGLIEPGRSSVTPVMLQW